MIEVADWGFVPSAAAVLADWGADVIEIEHPERGDPMRGLMFLAGGIAAALDHRERSGRGMEVDVSLLGNAVWNLSPDIVAAMTRGVS